MGKYEKPTLIGTLAGSFAWLGLGSWAYYTRNPVIEWIFISITTILITIGIIEAVRFIAADIKSAHK